MSGIYLPLTIGFGLISAVLCIWIISKLELISEDNFQERFYLVRLLKYLAWLTVEIGKSDWAITKVILSPTINTRHRLIEVPCNQGTDFGKMLFANSITITPGTVTVETETDRFIVHSLTDNAADQSELAKMGGRVCALEKSNTEENTT